MCRTYWALLIEFTHTHTHTHTHIIWIIWRKLTKHSCPWTSSSNYICHTYGSVMPRIQMNHVTRMNGSYRIFFCPSLFLELPTTTLVSTLKHMYTYKPSSVGSTITTHTWLSRGAHCNESLHTFQWVMVHTWQNVGPIELNTPCPTSPPQTNMPAPTHTYVALTHTYDTHTHIYAVPTHGQSTRGKSVR